MSSFLILSYHLCLFFCLSDDQCSHHSGMEVTDRLMYLEQRVQIQEDEIQLLKMTMADVLKRLNISEEQTAALTKRPPAKGNTHTNSGILIQTAYSIHT